MGRRNIKKAAGPPTSPLQSGDPGSRESATPQDSIQPSDRKAAFVPVPRAVLDDPRIKDPTTLAVYASLASFANYETGEAWPSFKKIGERARVSEDTAQRRIAKQLIPFGHIEKIQSGIQSGKSNKYRVVDPYGRGVPHPRGTAPVRQGYRTSAVGGTALVQDERDSLNEIQERKGSSAVEVRASAAAEPYEPTGDSFPLLLREKMEAAARAHGVDPGKFPKDFWEKSAKVYAKAEGPGIILAAFEECLSVDPSKARFFFNEDRGRSDFSKWAQRVTDRQRAELAVQFPKDAPLAPAVEKAMAMATEKAQAGKEASGWDKEWSQEVDVWAQSLSDRVLADWSGRDGRFKENQDPRVKMRIRACNHYHILRIRESVRKAGGRGIGPGEGY